MNLVEKMMFEGDNRQDFAAWMEEMKGIFIKPNSGTPMVIEEVVELKDIEFE